MTDENAEAEPSIEDILASIRKIITTDDGQPEEASGPLSSPVLPEEGLARAAFPEGEAAPLQESDKDILELTRVIEDDGSIIDLSKQGNEIPTLETLQVMETEPVPEINAEDKQILKSIFKEPEPEATTEEEPPLSVKEVLEEQLGAVIKSAVPESEPVPEPESEAVSIPEPESIPALEPPPAPEPEPVVEEVVPEQVPVPQAKPEPVTEPVTVPKEEETTDSVIVSQESEAAAMSAIAKLKAAMEEKEKKEMEAKSVALPDDKMLERMTAEMLRPALAEWLDKNLPSIVERVVEQEVAKITSRG